MTRIKRFIAVFIILFLLWPFGFSWSEEKKPFLLGKTSEYRGSDQPLRITSQTLEADNKNQVITFRGNVVAKQGEVTIQADIAQVYYEKKEGGNDLREIVATGNVKIHQGDRLATGQKAVLHNLEQKIILTGQPKIWQGKDMVSGEKITVLLDEDKSFVESGPDRRVEVILYPKGEQRTGKGKP